MGAIRFLSSNRFKIEEATEILGLVGVQVIPLNFKIQELQTDDMEMLIKDKTLKALEMIGRPLFVEHTGLFLNYLNGLPGGLTQVFWDNLEADRFSQLFGGSPDPKVVAKTVVGYCDGRRITLFDGQIEGKIAETPRGNRAFQWDCVFIPDGFEETFAEMGNRKNEISMRRMALEKLAKFVGS